jgi:hypothetical protein
MMNSLASVLLGPILNVLAELISITGWIVHTHQKPAEVICIQDIDLVSEMVSSA